MLLLLPPLLFVLNGLVLAKGRFPRAGQVRSAVPVRFGAEAGGVSIMAFNVAKGFVDQGGGRFADRADVQARLDGVAALVRTQHPDYLFLSEVAWAAGWRGVNQVTYLAEATGLTNWLFGENFCFGVPGYRIISGNAVLSRHGALRPVGNPDLAGRRPFYRTRNNRRMLVAESVIGGAPVRLYALHNDSFVPTNNLAQVAQILAHVGGRPAVLAGDFNATPDSASMGLLRASGRFSAEWSGPPTLPNVAPDRTIDYILAPAAWRVVEHRVLTNGVSDHCAVWTRFQPL